MADKLYFSDAAVRITDSMTLKAAVFFPGAHITIDDKELRVGNQAYSLGDVWEAQLWNEGQPAHFGFWLWPIPVEVVAIALCLFFRIEFFWIAFYTTVFTIDAVHRVVKEVKRASNHALMIDTNSGWVHICASPNYIYLKVMARAINKAVRNYILEQADIDAANRHRTRHT